MGLIVNPSENGTPSGIISNEKYSYSKKDTYNRLQEIQEASVKFIATKELNTCTMILTTLVNDDFYDRFKIDYWNDVTEHGTRFKDLIELSLMYKQLKQFLYISETDGQTTVTFNMGQSLMQEIANKTSKLYAHKYEHLF